MPSTSRSPWAMSKTSTSRPLLGDREVALGLFPLGHCLAPVDLSPDRKAGKDNGDKREPGDPKPKAAALRPL